jgi:hypothetical protein
LLTYFLNDFEMVPVAPIITGITFVFTFHMGCVSIYYYYYYYYSYVTSVSFCFCFHFCMYLYSCIRAGFVTGHSATESALQ